MEERKIAPTEVPNELVQSSTDLVWLNPKELQFFTHNGVLRLTIGNERSYWRVQVYRCFPLTDPDRYISVRDAMNKEIGLIRRLADLDPQSREEVQNALHRRYMMPIVRRILSVQERAGLLQWEVETDRGNRRFLTRAGLEGIEQPMPHQCVLTDLDGNRYHIPDITALDPISFALLRRWLL